MSWLLWQICLSKVQNFPKSTDFHSVQRNGSRRARDHRTVLFMTATPGLFLFERKEFTWAKVQESWFTQTETNAALKISRNHGDAILPVDMCSNINPRSQQAKLAFPTKIRLDYAWNRNAGVGFEPDPKWRCLPRNSPFFCFQCAPYR